VGIDPISALVIGGATVASGIISSSNVKQAADAQVKAQERAIDLEKSQAERAYQIQEPFIQKASTGLEYIEDFLQSGDNPYQQQELEEARSLNRRLAQAGISVDSPAGAKILSEFYANVNNRRDQLRLGSAEFLTNIGSNAANAASAAQFNLGGNIGNRLSAQGNVQAQRYINDANIFSSTVGGLSNLFGQQAAGGRQALYSLAGAGFA